MQRTNKTLRQEVCTIYVGHRRPLEQWRVPRLGLPLAWVLEALANKQTGRASVFQGISLKRRGREREKERERESRNRGSQISKKPVREAGLRNWSILYCSGKLFILLVVHRDQWIIQNYAVSAALTLIKTRLSFCKSFRIQRVSGDLHYLLARRPINILQPFSDKGNSVVLPKVWCHSQKALNNVTFLHSKDTTIYNKERGVQ